MAKTYRTRRKSGGSGRTESLFPRLLNYCRTSAIILGFTLLPFVVAECVLALMNVRPILYEEDPYVGFSSHIPLFVEESSSNGRVVMVTAENKRLAFNLQRFPKEKPNNAFRIFCMGGSTTYGHPYTDETSFCGWLREMLPVCDSSREWELINAGGVSYASYRVAGLMEELVRYKPDLFIIYTGHNEFLEDRTYGEIKKESSITRELRILLCRTRVFATLWRASAKRGLSSASTSNATDQTGTGLVVLPAEVDTILEHSQGPEAYHRDDKLKSEILNHFEFNLNRMIDIAQSANADIIFIAPASNLRDCSPFKSEIREGLSATDTARFKTLYQNGESAMKEGQWVAALAALDEASEIDNRHPDLHYLRGRALYAMERFDEAKEAWVRARDEDVCPLRATSELIRIVADVAESRGVRLVDAVHVFEDLSEHRIPGEDLFLDHVHPTIEGHRQIALAILDTMNEKGTVRPSAVWNDESMEAAKRRVEATIDPEAHGVALRNLSMVLRWAGKSEEADRLAQRATELAPDDAMAHAQRGATAEAAGRVDEAILEYERSIELDPNSLEAHFGLADIFADQGKYEKAVSEYREALRVNPEQPAVLCNLGIALGALGRIDEAVGALRRALEIKPDNAVAHYNLGNLFSRIGRLDEAAQEYRQTLENDLYSNDPRIHFNLGRVLLESGQHDLAIGHLRKAEQLAPDRPEILQGLAMCLLSHPNPNQRDARQAIALAEQANSLTGNNDFILLDTLASAFAASGDFQEAVRVQRQAVALAEEAGTNRIDRYRERLARYEKQVMPGSVN